MRRASRPRRVATALLLAMALAVVLPVALAAQTYLHTFIQASLVVKDPDAAAAQIAAWAEQQGGYFLERSGQQVVVRFPGTASGDFRSHLEQVAEFVVDYAPAARDLREEFLQIEAGISSRQAMLDLTLSFMAEADVDGTLALERQVNELVSELENLRAARNRVATDRSFATATVGLRARQQTVPDKRPSSFAWINAVDLYRLLAEVQWVAEQ
jgi:hypothetical protein